MSSDAAIDVMALHSCRCCLRRAPDKDLTTPYTHLGNTEIYSHMLIKCFNIHLSEGGESGICEVCVGRLRDASDFKLQVQRSQVELQARLPGALQLIDEKPPVKLEMEGNGRSEDWCYRLHEEFSVKSEGGDNETSENFGLHEEPVVSEVSDDASDCCKSQASCGNGYHSLEHTDHTYVKTESPPADEKPSVKLEVEDNETSEDWRCRLHEELSIKSEVSDDASDDCKSRESSPLEGSCGNCYLSLGEHTDYTYVKTETPPAVVRVGDEDPGARPVSASEQLAMACAVKIERIHGDEEPRASQTCLATSRRGPRRASRLKDLPDDTAGARAEEQAYTCDTCGEHFTDKSKLIKHVQEHALGAPYSCEICSKQFSRKHVLVKHKRTHMEAKTFSCEICRKEFSCKSNLSKHIILHPERKPYGCDICQKQFTLKGTLKTHTLIHSGERRHTCDICDKKNTRKHDLKAHIRVHTDQKPHTCEICKKQFSRRSGLTKHKRIHTKQLYTCECSKTFASSNRLRQHQQVHAGLYSCDICKKQFKAKRNIISHLRIHTGEKPYCCNICTKTFAHRSGLRLHRRTHTRDQLYTCDICKKQFMQKSYMNSHFKLRHTEKKPYSCEICRKSFVFISVLRRHQRNHTAGKPYTCNICKKQFKQKHHLERHIGTHTGEKPYNCDICSKRFALMQSLSRHQVVHTRIRTFGCDVCKRQIKNKSNLIKHIRTHTGQGS